jgi:hypothetical protein
MIDSDSLFSSAISDFADCCDAAAIFQEAGAIASLRYRFFHHRDTDFFVAAISIFSSSRY